MTDESKVASSFGDLVLRDVIASDIPLYHQYEQDPIANEMAAFPPRDWDRFSQHWQKLLADDEIGKRTILFDGQVVGGIVSWGDAEEREVGYWIDRAQWGKGVATRALALYLETEQSRPLYAHVAKHNIGSIRVLQKTGFVFVGPGIPHFEFGDDGIEELTLMLTLATGLAQ